MPACYPQAWPKRWIFARRARSCRLVLVAGRCAAGRSQQFSALCAHVCAAHAPATVTINSHTFQHAFGCRTTASQPCLPLPQPCFRALPRAVKACELGTRADAHMRACLMCTGGWGWPAGRFRQPGRRCALPVRALAAGRCAKSTCESGAAGLCMACRLVLRAAGSLSGSRGAGYQSRPRVSSRHSSRLCRSGGLDRPAARRNARENRPAANRTPRSPESSQHVFCRHCSRYACNCIYQNGSILG